MPETPVDPSTGAVYPVGLRLLGRRVVVVGGGQVAHRRVAGLLEARAEVTVISPEVTPALEALVTPGSVTWPGATSASSAGVTAGLTRATSARASSRPATRRCATWPPPITTTRRPSSRRPTGYTAPDPGSTGVAFISPSR